MEYIKMIVPAITTIVVFVCCFLRRKYIKKVYKGRPVLSIILTLLGVVIVLVVSSIVSRSILRIN